ncbi:tetratricopeptide repeat-containing sensor histidine kinase [Flavitalea flava]
MTITNYISRFFVLLLMVLGGSTPFYGQSYKNPDKGRWEPVLTDAEARPDSVKVNRLLEIADSALIIFLNGKDTRDLAYFRNLLKEIGQISSRLGYTKGIHQAQLLNGRLLFVQGNVDAGRGVYKQAMSYYRSASAGELSNAIYFLSNAWRYRTHRVEIEVRDSTSFAVALAYYQSVNDRFRAVAVAQALAFIHIQSGQVNRAIGELADVYAQQLRLNDRSRHRTTDMLAHSHAVTGKFKEALDYAFQSLKFAGEIKDSLDLGIYYYRIGRISYNLHEVEKGTFYLRQSLHQFEMQKDTPLCINVSLTICDEGMMGIGKYKEALDASLAILKKYPGAAINDYVLREEMLREIAGCYFHTKQYVLAEKYYLQAFDLTEQRNDMPHDKIPIYFDLAMLYLAQNKLDQADDLLNKTLKFSEQTNSWPAIKDVQLQLFRIDSIRKNYLAAIGHYQVYKAITDSMFNESKSKQVSELEVQYDTYQREKEVLLLTNQSKLQEAALKQQKFVQDTIIAGAGLLLLLLLVGYNRYQLKRRANVQLRQKQEKINEQNQALEKLVQDEKRLLLDKDKLLEEKEWLIREIHHRVKNNLQIVMSLLNSQSAYLKDESALAAIRESQHRVHAISLIHQKLYQSEKLSVIDMEFYIKEVVDYLADNLDADRRIKFKMNIEAIELEVAQAVPLGLIVNEAITNSVKYAFPDGRNGEVGIYMEKVLSGFITLTIRDNGVGLPPDFDWKQTQSLGMSLMKGLSKQLDAEFEIINKEGLTIGIKLFPVMIETGVTLTSY